MKRIDRIKKIFLNEEYQASTKMVACQNHHDEQLRILNELVEYISEYKTKFKESAETGISVAAITNYNNFMARLRLTSEKQLINVNSAQKNLDTAVSVWQSKKEKTAILDKLNVKLDRKNLYSRLQHEQKELDESVALRLPHNKSR